MSTLPFVSDIFDAARWRDVDLPGDPLTDMTFHRLVSRGTSDHTPAGEDLPVVRIAFDRPTIRNAFRPHTVDELYRQSRIPITEPTRHAQVEEAV